MRTYDTNPDDKRLRQSLLGAITLETLFFLALGLGHLSLFHGLGLNQTIETQVLTLPDREHLIGATASQPDDEVVFNPRHRSRKVKPKEPPKTPDQNKVDAEPDLGPTHGPVALYAPAPVIPAHLRDQDLKTSVVIEFTIPTQGPVMDRLLESSGNDELDAVALRTVTQWRFKPAAKDNQPVDSSTRLRINFEVR